MRNVVDQLWKQMAVIALLIGVDLAVSLPIMGATYRPFSWTSIAAGTASLYPVIQNLSFEGGRPTVAATVTPGAQYVLQRGSNLLNAAGWSDLNGATAVSTTIVFTDNTPGPARLFYRLKRLIGNSP